MSVLRGVALVTATASVVTGGSLYAFSTFVMPALDRLSGTEAIRAMQAINLEAPRSLLMLPLIGSLLGSAAVIVLAFVRSDTPHRGLVIIAAAVGLLGFLITAAYHVPHNDALAKLDPHTPNAAAEWVSYSVAWTRWNHARTLAYIASGVALVAVVARQG